MTDEKLGLMNVGQLLLRAAPALTEQIETFHSWMISTAPVVKPQNMTPVVENGRVISVKTPLGCFEVAEELTRIDTKLIARIVFVRGPTALRKEPEEVYSVLIFTDDVPHFGAGAKVEPFELDDWRDSWLPRNLVRMTNELAAAAVRRLA